LPRRNLLIARTSASIQILESIRDPDFISSSKNNYENPVFWLYLLVCARGMRFRPSPIRFPDG
jgi:hypothetical protein